ncbi:hypothetical protein, partial [Roseovarius amoyensis]|uniref:hypothetical protein n=1 Tax=Roseovarius amoyensis TaxID=2211448 RepID=UPI00195509DC
MLSFSQRASLDVIRSMAAFYVLLHHITPRLIDPPFLYIFKFGQEAVIVFFVLSAQLRQFAADFSGFRLAQVNKTRRFVSRSGRFRGIVVVARGVI